jgi:endonuclease/exonuclease/phosphatase family metal-dependent hydrolase
VRRVAASALATLLAVASCSRVPPPQIAPSALTCRAVVPDSATPVTWLEPSETRSRNAGPRWCATVGPVFFDDSALTARPPSDTLTVVVWNVHVGAGDIGALLRRLTSGEFTNGERVGDYVLLLQEVRRRDERVPALIMRGLPVPRRIASRDRTRTVDDLAALAREQRLALLYVPAMRNGEHADREDRGNAIVSTLPLDDVRVLELPFEHQRRVVPIATINARSPGGQSRRLRLATVHFDTSIGLRRGGPFKARRREAEALVAALADSDVPTVAAGDFNTWLGSREGAIGVLRRAFPETPAMPAGATWRGPLGMGARLDYVFVRAPFGPVTVRRLADRFGSDHYPLLARLRF